jgi:hypothetical protein
MDPANDPRMWSSEREHMTYSRIISWPIFYVYPSEEKARGELGQASFSPFGDLPKRGTVFEPSSILTS